MNTSATLFCSTECLLMLKNINQSHLYIVRQLDVMSLKLVFDGQLCDCEENIIEAFDFLFKLYWVFNLQYPSPLLKFFQFIQFKIYHLFCGKEKLPPSVNEVARALGIK